MLQIFFCADLTGINANVLFELGYAIAKNKRIWLILDPTLSESRKQFEQLRVLTTIGYARCCNSNQLASNFYKDQVYLDLKATLFSQTIAPNLSPTRLQTLLYLKSRHDTEASIRITKRIQESQGAHLSVITDDPQESATRSLTWYGIQVYSSAGVVCHLTSPTRDGARVHNARYALVAGMALGMGKLLLMLSEGDFLAPVDYRDLLRQYKKAIEAEKYLYEWLNPLVTDIRLRHAAQKAYTSTAALVTELRGLRFGDHVAENEAEGLVQDYFVETASYREALEGTHSVFVGRKGSGKTANLLKLDSVLRKDRRNLVCVIKPIAYELQGIIELLRKYKERDIKGYAIESLWKFLLYTEIANAALKDAQDHGQGLLSDDEFKLLEILERDQSLLREDFSVRLERSVEALFSAESHSASIRDSRLAISEALHGGILKELRVVLGKVLTRRRRVAILVDNLDKAWDKQSDLVMLSEFLLGLLGAARRLPTDFQHRDSRRSPVNVSLAMFLRSDIFYKVLTIAREPDKIHYSKLNWDDQEILLRVIEERFVASHGSYVNSEQMWGSYFCPTVKGISTKSYLTGSILSRPRDLLFLVNAAVRTAVNRGHSIVEESDILEAQKQYSQYAIDTIVVENGMEDSKLDDIILQFVGCKPHLSHQELCVFLEKAHVAGEHVSRAIDHLCSLTFLGVEVRNSEFRFAEDPQEHRKNVALAQRLSEKEGRSIHYMLNRAFWPFLEVIEH